MTAIKFTLASIKMFFRNKQGLFWSLFLPILIMVIFGLMNFGNAGKSNMAIVDMAKNQQSKTLISNLQKVDIISVTQYDNENDAKAKLEKGDLDLVLVIPKNFLSTPTMHAATQNPKVAPGASSQSLSPPSLKPIDITLYYNQGRQQQALAGTTVLKGTFDQITHQITGTPNLFVLNQKAVNSRNLNYIDFLVPGIIAMAIMQMGVFSIVFVMVQYRNKGIMKRLLVTPMKPIEFISGQVLTRMVVSVLQVTVIISMAVLIFHIHMIGSYLLLLFLVFLGGLLFISMGFAMSSLAKTEESAAPVANVIIFPMLFLSGIFFPSEAMPVWLQHIAYYFPLRFLADAMRRVMTEGVSVIDIRVDIYWLIIWAAIMIILAMLFFNFGQEE
jgi:ABC-2 type transport system permease protein